MIKMIVAVLVLIGSISCSQETTLDNTQLTPRRYRAPHENPRCADGKPADTCKVCSESSESCEFACRGSTYCEIDDHNTHAICVAGPTDCIQQ